MHSQNSSNIIFLEPKYLMQSRVQQQHLNINLQQEHYGKPLVKQDEWQTNIKVPSTAFTLLSIYIWIVSCGKDENKLKKRPGLARF